MTTEKVFITVTIAAFAELEKVWVKITFIAKNVMYAWRYR
jgi:hypothetical protein